MLQVQNRRELELGRAAREAEIRDLEDDVFVSDEAACSCGDAGAGGTETADYAVGQSTVTQPIVLTITDAGQSDVTGV